MLKTKKNTVALAVLFVLSIIFVSSAYAKVEYGIGYGGNRDYEGGIYATFTVKDLDECLRKCAEAPQCKAFAYARSANVCALKNIVGKEIRVPGMIAGKKM